MYLTLAAAALLATSVFIQLAMGRYLLCLPFALSAVLLFAVALLFRREKQLAGQFERWLEENREALEEGHEESYGAERIRLETVTVRFKACFSYVFFHEMPASRYCIAGGNDVFTCGLVCALCTLTFGLWAFPLGPVFVIYFIIRILAGGYRQSVAELLAGKVHGDLN